MENNIYIFGASSRGRTFREYATFLNPDTSVEAFLVDDMSDNKPIVDGIKVEALQNHISVNTEYPVYIATQGFYHAKITKELQALGMKYIYPVDVALDNRMRNAYVSEVYKRDGREFNKIPEKIPKDIPVANDRASIYVATSIYDHGLQKPYEPLPEEKVIQVGTALTEKRLENALFFDNTGDNISSKNRQYCELTALYWIWKNSKQDIVGLSHYRRHFILPESWVSWMEYYNIDVILPVPLYVAPSIEKNYWERHDHSNWKHMMEFLKKNKPSDYEGATKFFKSNLYSPCNMLIAKKTVINELCEWMFPILESAEYRGGKKEDIYQNRYLGFLSERLITYYFDSRRDNYNVAYADKVFLP